MEARILFVAPFADLFAEARTVVDEQFSGAAGHIKLIRGDLQACIGAVKQAVEDGVEVIVSRGGTAKLIEENVHIPVVPVQVTVIDILRAMIGRGKYPDRVGIAGFENVIYGCEDMESLLGITFSEIALQDEAQAEAKIAAAVEGGVELIVGDAISTKIAAQLGVEGVLIHSGRTAIYKAIKEAELIARIRRAEQEKSVLLRTVIDQSPEGIIAVDDTEAVTIFNPMAEKIFQVSHLEAVGRPLKEIHPQFQAAGEHTAGTFADVQTIGGKALMVKKSEIRIKDERIGDIYTLQMISQLQKLEQSARQKLHRKGLVAKTRMADIIGASPACLSLKRKASKYALTQSTILVTGESGTGKEMLVQSIHAMSTRAEGPFVAVNCAALPDSLLESELFGYEEGAFTGAKRGGRQGLFELAHGGTLFLDEIGEMPMALQSRLLRVLQEKAVMHLGGDSIIPVDVRIIAATNQHLSRMVEEKKFREDLYYRLNILRIHMPTLRERAEDIPLLAKEMVRRLRGVNEKVAGIDAQARAHLMNRAWPGNIRQLANTMERVMLLSNGPIITKQDVIEALDEEDAQIVQIDLPEKCAKDNLQQMERDTLMRVLAEENFNYSRAAVRLGIHRTTLWRKLNPKR